MSNVTTQFDRFNGKQFVMSSHIIASFQNAANVKKKDFYYELIVCYSYCVINVEI